jgi:hypothetical protein
MGKYVIKASARSSAPPNVVWGVLADASGWARWGPWQRSSLEREGDPTPDGVGALRRLERRPFVSREEVTIFEPPTRLGYELRSGLPLRGYRAEVTLSNAGEGTEINWRSEFDPAIPGTGAFFRWQLGRFIADVAERAAREAERQAGVGA